MTPETPSPSDESAVPPRQQPNIGELAKDSTERNLWAFDDGEELEEAPKSSPQKPVESVVPRPRNQGRSDPAGLPERELPRSQKTPETRDRVKPNVGASRRPTSGLGGSAGDEFGELDEWEPESSAVADEPSVPAISAPAGKPEEAAVAVPKPTASLESRGESSPPRAGNVARIPQRRFNLSKLDHLGLLVLMVVLVIGAVAVFFNSIKRLPSGAEGGEFRDFPVEGKLLTLESAETFWREPSAADTVRRGTQLLPVLKLTVRGGPAALRVFFRDTDGQVVGDAVSRSVSDEAGALEITATAGFEEPWMHDTYSTTGEDPWTVEIFEGPTQGSPAAEFKTLLKMNVSIERR